MFEKVASILSLLNTWVRFSPPGLEVEHGPLYMKTPGGDVLTHLWPGSERPTWTLRLRGPQLYPVWDMAESVAALVSLLTHQSPRDPWGNAQ